MSAPTIINNTKYYRVHLLQCKYEDIHYVVIKLDLFN